MSTEVIVFLITAISAIYLIVSVSTGTIVYHHFCDNQDGDDFWFSFVCGILWPISWIVALAVLVHEGCKVLYRKVCRGIRFLLGYRGYVRRKFRARYWEARAKLEEDPPPEKKRVVDEGS